MRKVFFSAAALIALATASFAEDAKPDPSAAYAAAAPLINGRFQIVMSTLAARDTFMIDTWSGEVWQLVENKKGVLQWQKMLEE